MPKLTYGLVGHPVSHSLSPAMHDAAFKSAGIDAHYELFDVTPEALEGFLDDLSEYKKVSGLNVTIPYKINAKYYLEQKGSLDENAKRLGAVNTIKVAEDGGLCGFNTDGAGFYRSLVEDLKFEPEGKEIFILGAGGAARAIVMYLGNGPEKIFVSDIDADKVKGIKEQYAKFYDAKKFVAVAEGEFEDKLAHSGLLVNATPIGMKESDPSPVDKSLLRAGLRVYDLVYNRPQTKLVKDAKMAKCHAVTGLGMLLYQGAISFEIWTGKTAPVDVMRKALREAIRG